MAKKPKTPFNKIMETRGKLDMYVRYGDHALQGVTPQEFAAEVKEAMDYLMTFRNIINSMVSFDETPEEAALFHIPSSLVQEAAEGVDA